MAESLGFGVKWEGSGDQKHLVLWKDNTHIDLKIGDKVAVVNEAQIQMDTSTIIIKEKIRRLRTARPPRKRALENLEAFWMKRLTIRSA
ncbi:hypothetical protein EHV15_25035 [Paenibacillus oralis]|uniref:Copper amine oxidase-like N-terminal domain-containing protein n=1 Tax=Paenibacillus oralis TaxID=2490856 RepID=A0A3P3U626_9BACL|nr:hypothetical protein EHV15_25035 [Paenibacillus oralis]